LITGTDCDNVSGLVGLIISLSSVCIILCLLSILIIICILTILIIITFAIICIQKNKKNFQLKNQELTEKLMMMNDLNKIPFNQIKFDKNNGKHVILGTGASSIVYSGKYNSKLVAIKELKADEFKDNLITEIVLLKNIDHNNIIKYYGYSMDQNTGNFYGFFYINLRIN
jgi:hypothetical protein